MNFVSYVLKILEYIGPFVLDFCRILRLKSGLVVIKYPGYWVELNRVSFCQSFFSSGKNEMVSLFVFCYVYGQSGEAIKFGSRVGRKASRKCLKKLPVIVSTCVRPFVGLFPFNRSSRFTFLHQSHLSFSLLVAFLPCNLLHRSVSHGQKRGSKNGVSCHLS